MKCYRFFFCIKFYFYDHECVSIFFYVLDFYHLSIQINKNKFLPGFFFFFFKVFYGFIMIKLSLQSI